MYSTKINSFVAIIVLFLVYACHQKKPNNTSISENLAIEINDSEKIELDNGLYNEASGKEKHYKKEAVVLTFDSAAVIDAFEWETFKYDTYGDTILRKSNFYFSDKKGNVYKLYAFKNKISYWYGILWHLSYSLNGYPLDQLELSHKYKGKEFNVTWENCITENNESKKDTIKILNHLSLVEYLDNASKRLVEVHPGDNLFDAIFFAQAYDSIVIKKGTYNISTDPDLGLEVRANHISVIGENGVFIYAGPNFDVLSIFATDVKIKNLYLAHTFATSCDGSVIGIRKGSDDVLISNCDINGCGAIGITFDTITSESRYAILNNQIHNNHICPFSIGYDYKNRSVEELRNKGVKVYNNKIWNNGENKTDEPAEYYHIFAFALSDDEYKKVENATNNLNIDELHRYKAMPDSLIPIVRKNGFEEDLIIAYINPSQYSGSLKKGVLILNKPNDVCFFNNLNEALTYFKKDQSIDVD